MDSLKKEKLLEPYNFFRSNTGSIEVNVEGTLRRVYFPIKPICRFLSHASKEEFMDTVDRSSA